MEITNAAKKNAIRFIVFLGCTSLFADMTYEGARSINGPFLKILGASGTTVGIVAGLGELVGYGLRLLSGYISDRSHRYWTILLLGYLINLLSVPLLAYAGYWQVAVVLMIAERAGKAIRTPTRDAMLSHASKETGRGWGFGLHEFMDQLGATIGPLLVSAVLVYQHDNFRNAYLVLLLPALCALSVLLAAQKLFPRPQDLEIRTVQLGQTDQLATPSFIIYTMAAMSLALGYADYPLIAYHFKQHTLVTDAWIPVLYSLAMLSEALTALWIGRLYDRIGPIVLPGVIVLSMFFAPLVFLGNAKWAIIGMILWGLGMGAQGSLLKAVVAGLVGPQKRATAFGVFDTFYGIAWFAGSAYMGYLYDRNLTGLVIFSMNMQLVTIIVLFLFIRNAKRK